MHKLFILTLPLMMVCICLSAEDKPLWMTKPVEITENKIKRRPDSIRMNDQDLTKWSLQTQNVSGARLELSGDYQLWEDRVAKLSFAVNDLDFPGQIDISLDPPLVFPENDFIEFWVNGPALFHGFFVADFTSADNISSRIEIVGGGHQWHRLSFWGTALTAKRPSGKPPWKLNKLEITIKPVPGAEAGRPQTIYFDEFAIAKKYLAQLPLHWRKHYPRPTTPDTILPAVKNPDISRQVRKNAECYEFTYRDGDKQLSYLYTPRTGTLSDLAIRLDNGTEFQVTGNGGVVADVNGVSIKPDTPGVKAELLNCDLRDDVLTTVWRRSSGNQSVTYAMAFELKQKSLIITASSTDRTIERFEFGITENTPSAKLVPSGITGGPFLMSCRQTAYL
jgi:hypothetical protein